MPPHLTNMEVRCTLPQPHLFVALPRGNTSLTQGRRTTDKTHPSSGDLIKTIDNSITPLIKLYYPVNNIHVGGNDAGGGHQ